MKEDTFSYYLNDVDENKEKLGYYLGFVVWPLGALIAALRYRNKSWAKNLFWLFCVFFGMTFIVAEVGGADSDRYARLFVSFAHSDMSLNELWKSIYAEGSSYVDIASPVITYLLSRFTDDVFILFTFFSVIFGYFYSRNLWYVFNEIEGRMHLGNIIFIITLALFNPIWNINAFRMWTAAQIFLFGALPYLFYRDMSKIIWCCAAVLFHFSFLFPVGILFLFIFTRTHLNAYFIFYLTTFFLFEIDLIEVRSLLNFLPSAFHARIIAYTNPEYAESIHMMQQSVNWYVTLSKEMIKWVFLINVVVVFLLRKITILSNNLLNRLLGFALLFSGFTNIFSAVPSMNRFYIIGNTFMIIFFIVLITKYIRGKPLFLIQMVSAPFLMLYCLVELRIALDYFGVITIIGNPIAAFFVEDLIPYSRSTQFVNLTNIGREFTFLNIA